MPRCAPHERPRCAATLTGRFPLRLNAATRPPGGGDDAQRLVLAAGNAAASRNRGSHAPFAQRRHPPSSKPYENPSAPGIVRTCHSPFNRPTHPPTTTPAPAALHRRTCCSRLGAPALGGPTTHHYRATGSSLQVGGLRSGHVSCSRGAGVQLSTCSDLLRVSDCKSQPKQPLRIQIPRPAS
jgi:hypothetical protein